MSRRSISFKKRPTLELPLSGTADQPSYGSYLDFFADSSMSRFRHVTRVGGKFPVRLLKIEQDAHEDEDPGVDELLIGLVLGGSAAARWRWGGGKWQSTNARLPGEIGISPHKATGLFQVSGPSRMLVIGIPVEPLRQVLGETAPLDFGELHERYAHNPAATRLCLAMWRAAGVPSAVSDDLIEDAVTDLIGVLRSGAAAKSPALVQMLSSEERAKIDARIHASCAEQLHVRDLAALLDMPVKTFRRSFSHTTGIRPHAYLLEHRIRQGMLCLENSERAIAEIALDLGFANQAHFTMVFSRQLGVSPLKYRRLILE